MPTGIYDRPPIEHRLWSRVQKGSGCWEWVAPVSSEGYGFLTMQRRKHYAHRVSWELAYGAIPAGLCVLHRCDNRRCVRPDHLFLGSRRDNSADMTAKGRHLRRECRRGHVLEGNRYVNPNHPSSTECWTCRRDRQRRRSQAVAA